MPSPEDKPVSRLDMRLTSDPAQVRQARLAAEAMAQRCGFDAVAVADIGLCVNEAVANIIRHAYGEQRGKPVTLSATHDPAPAAQELRISIRDWGQGIDPSHLPLQPHDPMNPGGLGLVCLRSLMHEVRFEKQDEGMLLTMIRRRAPLPGRTITPEGRSA